MNHLQKAVHTFSNVSSGSEVLRRDKEQLKRFRALRSSCLRVGGLFFQKSHRIFVDVGAGMWRRRSLGSSRFPERSIRL